MMGRVLITMMLFAAVVAGGALYYLQVYAYYDEITAAPGDLVLATDTGPQALDFRDFRGIDSNSSPLRYRACLTVGALPDGALLRPLAEPRVAPDWFDCFDAARIGADLQSGAATAYLGVENLAYGIDRVIAIYPDGRGFIWHDINACGDAAFNREPVPDTCPPAPESLQ